MNGIYAILSESPAGAVSPAGEDRASGSFPAGSFIEYLAGGLQALTQNNPPGADLHKRMPSSFTNDVSCKTENGIASHKNRESSQLQAERDKGKQISDDGNRHNADANPLACISLPGDISSPPDRVMQNGDETETPAEFADYLQNSFAECPCLLKSDGGTDEKAFLPADLMSDTDNCRMDALIRGGYSVNNQKSGPFLILPEISEGRYTEKADEITTAFSNSGAPRIIQEVRGITSENHIPGETDILQSLITDNTIDTTGTLRSHAWRIDETVRDKPDILMSAALDKGLDTTKGFGTPSKPDIGDDSSGYLGPETPYDNGTTCENDTSGPGFERGIVYTEGHASPEINSNGKGADAGNGRSVRSQEKNERSEGVSLFPDAAPGNESIRAVDRKMEVPEIHRAFNDDTVITTGNGPSIRVSVELEEIGKLDIHLSSDKGMVHARINATENTGRELIDKNMGNIINTLADEGITIGSFSIHLKDRQREPEQKEEGRQAFLSTKGEEPLPALYTGSGMVNIFV